MAGTGVLGKGLVRGAWYVFSAGGASFSQSILAGAGFGRPSCFFPDAISLFLACNTSMYLFSSASFRFSFPQRKPRTSSSSLIDSKWAKRHVFFFHGAPTMDLKQVG